MSEKLNEKHANARVELHKHVRAVQGNILSLVKELIDRANQHDDSKFDSPEAEIFEEHTEELGKCEYGSKEYQECLDRVKPALDHHYANNTHHPEHWPRGINDMDLLDIVELLCDWAAATKRNKAGNIHKSILNNKKRFEISDQLADILTNTVNRYF